MNIKTLKYKITPFQAGLSNRIEVEMPSEAELLDAAWMDGDVWVWASFLVSNEKTLVKKVFYLYVEGVQTGEIDRKIRYFRSVFRPGTALHIFHEAW